MKKIFTLAMLIASITLVSVAQTDSSKYNLLSKRGFYYFPEQDDWSIGVDATPLFTYIGSLIGNKTIENHYYNGFNTTSFSYQSHDAPQFAFTAQNPGSIYFKYMETATKAYRVKFLFGYSSHKDNLGSGTSSPDVVSIKETALSIGLEAGIEYYRPIKSKIIGYYGYQAGFLMLPYVGERFNSNEPVIGNIKYVDETISYNDYTEKGGSTWGLTAAGFVGIEWFFAPKVSLKGEFGLGAFFNKQGERKYESEGFDAVIDSGGSSFEVKPYASGNFILSIYF